MLTMDLFAPLVGDNKALMKECNCSFSQSGEDIVIQALLRDQQPEANEQPGFFFDVGAYHPFRYSNTFLLYLRGWRGVNIDANANAIAQFQLMRPDDINLHALVSDQVQTLKYFKFEEGAWNTTNESAAKLILGREPPSTRLIGEELMQTQMLDSLLEAHVINKRFDLLNIDVEGMDQQLLFSIDFDRFRPKVIALEIAPAVWSSEPMKSFLKEKHYELYAQCVSTAVLVAR
jgi:FkbM family methyltransferase